MTPKQVEDAAIAYVIKYEKKEEKRCAKDVRREKGHEGYDIFSEGKKIEVKSRGPIKGGHLLFCEQNIKCFEDKKNEDNYLLYVVMGIREKFKSPELKILTKKDINNLKPKKERHWIIPTKKDFYNNTIKLKKE